MLERVKEQLEYWLNDPYFDEKTRKSSWPSAMTRKRQRIASTRILHSEPADCAASSEPAPTV